MPRKNEVLSELLSTKTKEIVSSPANYTAFLRTAAQNYKYSFREQVLIFAQRPDATACAEAGLWKRLGRQVNRSADEIALLVDPSPYRVRYVYDVSDTSSRENRPIPLWHMDSQQEEPVLEALNTKFQMDQNGTFPELVDTLSQRLALEACDDFLPDLLDNKRGSFLEELDEDSIASWFIEAASESVHYMILYRCGYESDQENTVFRRVLDFNTVRTATILGIAVSTLSESVLREIGITVKALNKQRLHTFDSFGDRVYNEARKKDMERSNDDGTDLHDDGRTPAA